MCGKSIDFLESSVNAGNVYGLSLEKSQYFTLTSDSYYQEFLVDGLTQKYDDLSKQCDKIIRDANSEISSLQKRVSGKYYELLSC